MMRFEPNVEQELRVLGWYPGRRDEESLGRWKIWAVSRGMTIHARAEDALVEFGHLTFAGEGLGITIGKTPFVIDPTRCSGSEDWLEGAAEDLGEVMSPLGQVEHGKAILVMSESGYVYAVGDFDVVMGSSMEDALRRMVLGIKWDGQVPDSWED